MNVTPEEYHLQLLQDVAIRADSDGQLVEDAFFDHTCEHLTDVGELSSSDRAYFAARGVRIDGYGGDPRENEGVLSLIATDFSQSGEIQTLTRTDMEALFRRTVGFLERSHEQGFRNSLEETSPAFGLADLIAATWSQVTKVRVILITDKLLSSKVDGYPAGESLGKPVTYNVWDLSRFHRLAQSQSGGEEIEVDLVDEFGGAIPILSAHLREADYQAYLAVVPGSQLAAIYDRWGARLLEQNVRVFLQARSSVNRGIRNTLDNSPEMFFAYNNGITATAASVDTRDTGNGLELVGIQNFQIVNGGQTTASIHAASQKKDGRLAKVFVQMKLSIVPPELTMDVVPKISEYANSQNRVNAADFFSNHPFHVRIEGFSRRVFAPSPDGTFRESKWFYERARGQYLDARGNKTPAERQRFDLEFPRRNVFTKTDLAKFANVWEGKPHIVSKGAQKNFAEFAEGIGRDWERSSNDFNEMYYRHLIAKAIIFKEVEKLVSAQDWYEGGYRANVVAYAISKLANDLKNDVEEVDFDRVWRAQSLSSGLGDALTTSAAAVHEVIVNPPTGARNVTEWAKQQACWNRVRELKIKWPDSLSNDLISRQQRQSNNQAARKDQRVLNGIEAQTAVFHAGAQFWREVKAWGMQAKLLSPRDQGVLDVASTMPDRIPTEAQCNVLCEVLKRLQENGCALEFGTGGTL